VGRLGGVRRAAAALDLDHGVVSRHIRTLEDWVGVPLVDRPGGNVVLTDLGKAYHSEISTAFLSIASATLGLKDRQTSRRLIVCSVPGFCTLWLANAIDAFQKVHPSIGIEVRPAEVAPDLGRMEADIDIRYQLSFDDGAVPTGLRAASIVSTPTFPIASPAYLASIGPIPSPEALLEMELLHEDGFDDWADWFVAHGVDAKGKIDGARLWHANLTVDFARRGRGVALANSFLVGDDLETGKLMDVLSHMKAPPAPLAGDYVLYARADRWNSSPIACLRQYLTKSARMGMAA
jgi:DNA-binding transcriptional LysR family regulator